MFTEEQKSNTEAILTLAKGQVNYKSTTEDAVTLTAAEFINGVYLQTGTPGTSIKTTPTAAAIVAAILGVAVGSSFDFMIDNQGDDTLTLAAGSGVTLVGTATIAATKNRSFKAIVTNITPASEAVRVIAGPTLA